MIAIGISATPIFIRLTRAQVLAVKVEDYVEAARAVGNSHLRIALRHILPNIVAPLIVQATLAIAAAVIAEASLSFLGLGQQPPAPSWGSMLNTAKNYVDNAPWMAVWPGVSIFLLVLSFNLLGDGLRDALDPRQEDARQRDFAYTPSNATCHVLPRSLDDSQSWRTLPLGCRCQLMRCWTGAPALAADSDSPLNTIRSSANPPSSCSNPPPLSTHV